MAFGDPCCDGAHAGLRDELDVYPRRGIGVFEVVYELRQVFDGVDVVVRRRRDELDPRRRATYPSDVFVDFAAGKLAPFAGL